MYAIIEDSGQQFKVSAGDVIQIDKRELAEDADTITFDRVLLIGDDGEGKIGTPLVDGAKVVAKILVAEAKGKKIDVIKIRRRKGYRRKQGHRQKYVEVKIDKIVA